MAGEAGHERGSFGPHVDFVIADGHGSHLKLFGVKVHFLRARKERRQRDLQAMACTIRWALSGAWQKPVIA